MSNYHGYQSREPTFDDYYRSMARSGAEPQPRETRHTVEEMYARGRSNRSPPSSKGYRRYDDDSDDGVEVQYRRQVRQRARARSVSTERSRPKRRSSVGASAKGRELVRYESRSTRRRGGGNESESDSDDDDDKTICYSDDEEDRKSRQQLQQQHKHTKKCGPKCGEKPNLGLPPAFRHPHPDEEYDSETDLHERKKRRNKRALYTGLAALGTIATCNGVYQNQKAWRARRHVLDTANPECAAEAKALKKKIIIQDLIALGVVGVGLNNVRLGWARQQALKKEDQEARAKWQEHRAGQRRQSVAAVGGADYR